MTLSARDQELLETLRTMHREARLPREAFSRFLRSAEDWRALNDALVAEGITVRDERPPQPSALDAAIADVLGLK